MTEKFAEEQDISSDVHVDELTAPKLFLTSEGMGWEDLVVSAFHEPVEFEGSIAPDTIMPYIPLVLFTGGTMYMEQRPINGPWKGGLIRSEDLILITDESETGELRWRGLTREPMQTLHLNLSKDVLVQTAEELAGYDPAQLKLVGRSGFQDPLLTQIGFTLWRELEMRTPTGKLYAQTAAQMLAVHLLRHYTSAPVNIQDLSQKLTRQQVKRVTDFVLAHLNQDLSLEALAQQTGFSSYYFARLFRQTLGESPHQFILRQRVEKAQNLLRETRFSLAHIALESGFANQSHLTRIFKRYLGVTPRAYRQDREISAHSYQDSQE